MRVYVLHRVEEYYDLDGACTGGGSEVLGVFTTKEAAEEYRIEKIKKFRCYTNANIDSMELDPIAFRS